MRLAEPQTTKLLLDSASRSPHKIPEGLFLGFTEGPQGVFKIHLKTGEVIETTVGEIARVLASIQPAGESGELIHAGQKPYKNLFLPKPEVQKIITSSEGLASALNHQFERQKDLATKVVAVGGPSGAGKTTTVEQIAQEAEKFGMQPVEIDIDSFFFSETGSVIRRIMNQTKFTQTYFDLFADYRSVIEAILMALQRDKKALTINMQRKYQRTNGKREIVPGTIEIPEGEVCVILSGVGAMQIANLLPNKIPKPDNTEDPLGLTRILVFCEMQETLRRALSRDKQTLTPEQYAEREVARIAEAIRQYARIHALTGEYADIVYMPQLTSRFDVRAPQPPIAKNQIIAA